MHHVCSECQRPIGLMADERGGPKPFLCPRTKRMATPHVIVSRSTPKRRPILDALPEPKVKAKTKAESSDSADLGIARYPGA